MGADLLGAEIFGADFAGVLAAGIIADLDGAAFAGAAFFADGALPTAPGAVTFAAGLGAALTGFAAGEVAGFAAALGLLAAALDAAVAFTGLFAMFLSTPWGYVRCATRRTAPLRFAKHSRLREMSESAVQIIARGPRDDAEAAAAAIDIDPLLEGATYSILEEDEDRGLWRIDAFPVNDTEADAFRARLADYSALMVATEILADADWLAMALSGLPPVRAGRFFIYGLHDRGRTPVNAISLRIEAGAAFGTGHHGTTVGCLFAYDALLKRRRFGRVLDVGAGTGVLAIAAARTGSRTAVGTDIDRVSVRISRENARVNASRAEFVWAFGLNARAVRRNAPYELVFANILARPLVGLAQDIREALEPSGIAILSGLLRTQERFVRAAYLNRGFRLLTRIRKDAWCTLVLERR